MLFEVWKTNYKSKIPIITKLYYGYRGFGNGLGILWNGKALVLLKPINERDKFLDNIDKKFEKIGFVKLEENQFGARYERMDECHDYVQVLHIGHKDNGNHIVQSYDKNLMDSQNIGNTCVGLSCYEMKLALKKMRKLGLKTKVKRGGRQ